ncbi:MAG TPA: RHS repeat domain-containing protein [Verrucomicrobiae bacterium]|nr:RHS repeat domain-containing protein [Verrucomicrobiae bacterium]
MTLAQGVGQQAGLESFDYSPLGAYDEFGRVTNKVDASGVTNFIYRYDADDRLTNRWTPAKGLTVYHYDPLGNVTNVDYSGGTAYTPSIYFAYDFLNPRKP